MLLDFSNYESCLKTLDSITNISLCEIYNLADKKIAAYGYYTDSWIDNYIKRDLFEDYSKIYTTFFHITTTTDPKGIQKHGLQNLQTVLSTDNFLSSFLRKYNIRFDILNRKMYHGNKIIDLKKLDNTEHFYRLSNRIDNDFNVNGFYFFSSKKSSEYSTVDEIPEFLYDTLRLLFSKSDAYSDILKDWRSQTSRFVVKAEVPITKIDIGYNEDFPLMITSKLLDIFLAYSEDMIPSSRDIIYLSRQEVIDGTEIKSITELPIITDSIL